MTFRVPAIFAAATLLTVAPLYAQEERAGDRKSVEDFWRDKGVEPHVAAGIADNVSRESGFDPARIGDGGSSLGLYQHHNERMDIVLARIENEQAFRDVMGADPIAAAHWDEIKHAASRPEARRLWAKYFERCANCDDAGTHTHVIGRHHQRVKQDPAPVFSPAVGQQTDPFSPESKETGSSFLITREEERK